MFDFGIVGKPRLTVGLWWRIPMRGPFVIYMEPLSGAIMVAK